MEIIIILGKCVVALIGLLFLLAYAIILLMIMLITPVHFLGYICDVILGNLPYKGYEKLCEKFSKISKYDNIYNIVKPKKIYLRYETPACTFCFSYIAILIIGYILHSVNIKYSIVVGAGIYIVMYFGGMYRKCKIPEGYYNGVLDNNLNFLKLSFVPLTFIVTVVGFGCTIMGTKIQDLIKLNDINNLNILKVVTQYSGNGEGLFADFISLVIFGAIFVLLLYIASIPMQLVSYFIILIIKYLTEYKKSYCNILHIYVKILKEIGRIIYNFFIE